MLSSPLLRFQTTIIIVYVTCTKVKVPIFLAHGLISQMHPGFHTGMMNSGWGGGIVTTHLFLYIHCIPVILCHGPLSLSPPPSTVLTYRVRSSV